MATTEYITIGSTGFSQFGTPDYYERQRFEGDWLLRYFETNFKLHPNLWLKWKREPYEYDSYWELNVCFRDNGNIPEETMDKMWNCINELESFDIESLHEQISLEWADIHCKVIDINSKAA